MQPPNPSQTEDKFQALNRLVSQQTPASNRNNPNNESRTLYVPTPKETAYTIYILQQSFPASFQLYSQNQTTIRINGKDAVAFLTTSGIHRLILRILWTVVDPNNFGTLTEIAQFHTILRLVALTQAGHVEPELLSVGTLPPPKPTPVQVVWSILAKHSTTLVPLAKFEAVPLPNPQQLQQIYMLQQRAAAATAQQQQMPPTGIPGSNDLQQQQQQQALPNLNFPDPKKITSAFGGFMKSAIGALNVNPQTDGGLQPFQPEKTQLGLGPPVVSTGEFDPGEDDFGGFTNAAVPSSLAGTGVAGIPTQTHTGMSALDALGPATDAPLPSLSMGGPTPMGQPESERVLGSTSPVPMGIQPSLSFPGTTASAAAGNDDDEFGGFAEAAPVPGMAALDAFGQPSMDAPLPALSSSPVPPTADAFGGFSSAGQGISAPDASLGPATLAALGALGPTTDTPALGGGSTSAVPPSTQTTTTTDAFGGFAGAAAQPAPVQGLAALDALGAATDAPLPALGTLGSTEQPTEAAEEEEDDFGGFEEAAAAPATNTAPTGMAALDAFGSPADAPLPSLGTAPSDSAPANNDDDDFGGFADATAQPAAEADEFGGFTDAPQQTTSTSAGMSAFDALTGVQDAPLPGMGQPQSERVLGSASPVPPSAGIQQSLSFPGTGGDANAGGMVSGMSAFDALAPPNNAPLPDLGSGTASGDMGDVLQSLPSNDSGAPGADANEASFGSFTDADGSPKKGRRSLRGSFRRRSSKSLSLSPETVPKDLMPAMPGERYVAQVRQNSLRKLPEIELDSDEEKEHADPFAGLDPSPSTPMNLNAAVPLTPGAEIMPQDLTPSSPGERFVQHGKNEVATPGGLKTLAEPNNENEDDDFGDFEDAPASIPSVPTLNTASEPNPFSESMPHDMFPHAPGEHYVPHGAHASRTPGGLSTVGEGVIPHSVSPVPMSDLNPPTATGLWHEETLRPKDLKPHAPGEHYVPHSHDPLTTPGGLSTVGEAFGDMVQVPDAKLPGLGEALPEDDFGDFSTATSSAGSLAVPPPVQLSRQATPAAQDLDPLTKKVSSAPPNSTTIQEEDENEEDEDDFGDFAGSTSLGLPGQMAVVPPTQMKRQETPRPQDLRDLRPDPPTASPSDSFDRPDPPGQLSPANLGILAETIEEDFGSFTQVGQSAGASTFAPPTVLSRQATPAVHELQQLPRKTNVNNNETIFEETEEQAGFGAFNAASREAAIPPPAQLSRQATPAAKDLDQLKQKAASGGALEGMAIQEGDEDGDDFGDFSAGMPGEMEIVAPPQMNRTETPRPQDIKPNLPGAVASAQPGLSAIGESQDPIAEEDSDASTVTPDPFAAFDTLAAPSATLAPLPTHGAGAEGSDDPAVRASMASIGSAKNAPSLKENTSLDVFSLQRPNTVTRQPSSDASVGRLGSRSTCSLLDDSDEEEDEKAASFRNVGRSVSPIPSKIGISNTPMISEDSDDAMDGSRLSGFGDPFDFGDFTGAADVPAPSNLSRQATPAAKDLDPLTKKASAGAAEAITILEEENEEEDGFGSFSGPSTVPPPSQLSRQATPAAQDLDPLTKKASAGAMGGTTIEEGEEDAEEDGFGDFGGFTAAGDAALPPPTQLSRQATPAAQDLDPLTKKASAGPTAAAIQEGDEEEDEFGDFGGFSSGGDAALPPPTQLSRQATPAAQDLDPLTKKASAGPTSAAIQEGDEEEDEFGDFGGFSSTSDAALPPPTQLSRQATPAAKDLEPLTKKASAGPTAAAIQEGNEEEEDDFGDFSGFSSAGVPPPTQLSRQATPAAKDLDPLTKKVSAVPTSAAIQEGDEEEDDFGDFGGFEQASSEPHKGGSAAADDFGSFAAASTATDPFAASPAPAPVPAPIADDDFGDFSSFAAAPAPAMPVAESGSWDAFQAAPATGGSTNPLRKKIVTMSTKMPEQFHKTLEYGALFDATVGKTDHQKRAERSVQVLSLLTSTKNKKLAATYWTRVLDVARDELALGNGLLENASALSTQEQKATKQPLETMVAGMGEYVRATRSIVASLGDMLLLEVSTPLNESTLGSSWGSMPLAKKAVAVEKLWRELVEKSSSMGLQRSLNQLETIVEIRTKCLSRCPSTKLCQLSLQPLSDDDKQTTKATVDWCGKPFMACSANFLANKCPFYVIND